PPPILVTTQSQSTHWLHESSSSTVSGTVAGTRHYSWKVARPESSKGGQARQSLGPCTPMVVREKDRGHGPPQAGPAARLRARAIGGGGEQCSWGGKETRGPWSEVTKVTVPV